MKFSTITPTYKRPDLLKRLVDSFLLQEKTSPNTFAELIIVNDSPDHDYREIERFIDEYKKMSTIGADVAKNNFKITYFKNKENMGVNFSRNFALKYIYKNVNNADKNDHYVTFYDDDDWMNKDTLCEIESFVKEKRFVNEKINWIVTNRVLESGERITKVKEYNKYYNYLQSHRILKTIKNDSTSFISFDLLKDNNILYSTKIKQAEELIFWHHVNKYTDMYLVDLPSTVSCGYLSDGLTHNKDSKIQRLKHTFTLLKEAKERKVINFDFVIYLILRIVAIIVR